MKHKEKNKLIITIIAVLVIIIIVAGATFSYFSWRITEENETNITVKVGGATLNISGDNVINDEMYPTTCNTSAALKGTATVTAINSSNMIMETKLKIRASLFAAQGTLNESKLSKIHWAIVDTTKSCLSPNAQGTFANVVPATSRSNFPNQTYTDIDTTISFEVPQSTTIIKTYDLYVWIDSDYEHTNVGETVSDPVQDLLVSVKWSEASTLTQKN